MMELSFGVKRNYYVKSTLYENLRVVFGSQNLITWLSPLNSPYPDNLETQKARLLEIITP